MTREPDWESLSQLQFLLMRRVTEPLNAALAAIALVHLDEAADRSREFWQSRATQEVLGVLNLVNAWHALLRFKLGELLPRQHIRPFNAQTMLDWLTMQLELSTPLRIETDMVLESSPEALQEALLLLYSAAFTLGPSVRLVLRTLTNGLWFRIRYNHPESKPCPPTLDTLLETLRGNWRLEDTAFEIRLARDFIALSGSKLHFQGTDQFCEFAFFVYAAGKRPLEPLETHDVNEPPPASSPEDSEELPLIRKPDEATHHLPDAELENMISSTLNQIFGEDTSTTVIPPADSPAGPESPDRDAPEE
ncbi:MAG: hypothetical protein Kow0077_01020 [Anaerolineae bacterium]